MTMSGQAAAAAMKLDAVGIARLFAFVREAQTLGQNRGLRVEAIQHWSGGSPGDSWCAEFATMVLDIAWQGNAPLPRTGSCEILRALAEKRGWLTSAPVVGDLFLYLTPAGVAHHVGIVTSVDPLIGIAGNTSAPDAPDSTNGDRVAEKPIPQSRRLIFVHLPSVSSPELP